MKPVEITLDDIAVAVVAGFKGQVIDVDLSKEISIKVYEMINHKIEESTHAMPLPTSIN